MPTEIFDKVKKIIVNVFFDPKYYDHSLESIVTQINHLGISKSSRLVEDLHMDSLFLMELVISIEESFQFQMTKEAFERISTVGDLVRLIEQQTPNDSIQ